MEHYNQNTKIVSASRTRNHQVELKEDPINITYGLLDQIFKVLDEEDILAKQIILCLATLSKNSENVIANIVSCYELFKTGKFHTFLVSFMILASCPE